MRVIISLFVVLLQNLKVKKFEMLIMVKQHRKSCKKLYLANK